jgi:hypothetical protein
MREPHDFTSDEKARLAAIAEEVGRKWSANPAAAEPGH